MLESLHFLGFVDYEDRKMAHVETCEDCELPLNIFIDNYENYAGLEDCHCEIDIQGVSHDVEIFASEDDYHAAARTMAPVSLIPCGTFPLDSEDKTFVPSPDVLFSGIVQNIGRNLDADEDEPNYKLTIATYGFTFDLYIDYDGDIALNSIVCGTAWLFGDIVSLVYDKDELPEDHEQKAALTPDDVAKLLKPPEIRQLSMIRNSDEDGNNAFVIRADKEDKVHVSVVPVSMKHLDTILELLSITHKENAEIGIDHVSNLYDGRSFLVFYNPLRKKPYPLVVAAKYITNDDGTYTLVNAEMEDMAVVPHIQEDFLTAKKPFELPLKMNSNWNGANAEILTEMGYAYEKGTIFEQNYDAALQLYRIAAESGDAVAISNMGWMYHQGLGVEKNIAAAMCFYQRAAEAGCTTAMVNLGNIYEFGELGEPDYKECFKWYKKAAEAGDNKGLFNYANCYHWGYGTRKSYKKAFSIFKQLADKGYRGAKFYIGLYYQDGKGVKRDYEQARRYYRLGALEGDMYCFNQLGVLYEGGYGVKKDVQAAFDYYMEAARLGDSLADFNIGRFYESGKLGYVDVDKAISYYKVAAEHGEQNAIEALNRLCPENVSSSNLDGTAESDEKTSHAVYYLIDDSLVGKREAAKDYLYQNDTWIPDDKCVIADHLAGFDSSEPSDSPYRFGNHSVMEEMREITVAEALAIIQRSNESLAEKEKGQFLYTTCERFDESQTLDNYRNDIVQYLMLCSWHYSKESATAIVNREAKRIKKAYSEKLPVADIAVDIGYCCG